MAEQNRTTLKGYFETGDKPTQTQFEALIDGVPNLTDSSVSDAEFAQLDGVTSPIQTQIDAKQGTITAGTTAQYYRGDKSFQTLDKTAVGLTNVNDTSDANKEVSTPTQTALDLKANLASPTFTGNVKIDTKLGVGVAAPATATFDTRKDGLSTKSMRAELLGNVSSISNFLITDPTLFIAQIDSGSAGIHLRVENKDYSIRATSAGGLIFEDDGVETLSISAAGITAASIQATNGATGSFTAQSGEVVTVVGGIITSIA